MSLGFHWEHGYRCHGLWKDTSNERFGHVSLGPAGLWRAGRDKYMWGLDVAPYPSGETYGLRQAKKKVEKELQAILSVRPDVVPRKFRTSW